MLIDNLLSLVRALQTDTSVLFLEFEEIFAIASGFILILMYLFYVRYSYDKDDAAKPP